MKLTTKADKGVYGALKREMWRETVSYLENWADEAQRDLQIEMARKNELAFSERRVKEWEAKAKL